jgi:Fur family transcriptional regulator, ferric uptake regulator
MSADTHLAAATRLRLEGHRYTSNRKALVDVLLSVGQPLTIPEILGVRRGLPQSSVYRNLAVLQQADVVRRVVGAGEFARYELTEDLTEHHHHLICTSCGTVADFTMPRRVETSLGQAMGRAASGAGFSPQSHRVDVIGLCDRCA